MKIIVDGKLEDVDKVQSYGYLPLVEIGKADYYVAENAEVAGEAARRYWQEMADKDPKEFTALIGEERLVQWAMGQSDSYGFSSLHDFLDAVEGAPEDEFATYNGQSCEVSVDLEDANEYKDAVEWNDNVDTDHIKFINPEHEAIQDELDELADELGFRPTVGYRHN